ncbi:MAG: endonuclease [Dialister sp.]|nr:endonuclease [Dialister sp.]
MAYTNCDLILSVKDADDRDEWLKVRNMGIGGSDASTIMGLNSYKSPYQLWLEKIGEAAPEDLTGNPFVYWGQKNEANIADWFNEETGKKVQRLGTLRNKDYPFMIANVDRTVIGENAGLEIKTAGVSQYKKWKGDEIPDAYYCQCLHYMAVTGADYWYIAVLLGGNEARWKKIERNEDDIKVLIEKEREFWNLVQTKTAPPVDGSLSCSQALAARYADSRDEEIMLPEEADTLIASINSDTEIMDRLQEQIDLNKNRLKEMLGEAEMGRIGSFQVIWKLTSPRETCSLSKVKKAAPEVYQMLKDSGYISIGKASRRFSIKEVKEEK